jgi:hypothetical protein
MVGVSFRVSQVYSVNKKRTAPGRSVWLLVFVSRASLVGGGVNWQRGKTGIRAINQDGSIVDDLLKVEPSKLARADVGQSDYISIGYHVSVTIKAGVQ